MTIVTQITRAVDEHEARCMFATTESVVRTALAAMLAEFGKPENVERLASELNEHVLDYNGSSGADSIRAILAEMAKC